jgi:PKHD-type hydroxylase
MWEIKYLPLQAWIATHEMFTNEELARIWAIEGEQFKARVGLKDGHGDYNPKQRDSDITWISPHPDTHWLFQIIEDAVYEFNKHFMMRLTHIHDLQKTEYRATSGGHFGPHIDDAWGVLKPHGRRKLSICVQMSEPDEYDGGELRLYPQGLAPVMMPKTRGMAVVFRSHIIHEVTPVTRGVRKSLVIWVSGPYAE